MSIPILKRGIPMLAILLAVSSAPAADRANDFSVTDEQVRALGIELIALDKQGRKAGQGSGIRYPAVVVLPPRQQRVVSAPVAGLVTQVLIEENQTVQVGTPLLVLSSPELGRLQLAVVQAANRARLAKKTAARERTLFGEGIIAERRVVEADTAASDSRAEFTQATAALRLAGLSELEVARVADASVLHDELTITARSAGTVIGVDVKPGRRVTEIEPLLRIARLDELWIDVQVPSAEAAQWPPGSKLTVTGDLAAEVLSVSPLADNAQRVLLRARLVSNTTNLRPGEFVQVDLPVAAANAWQVPLSALARDGNQAYVFVRVDDRFKATPVEVLANTGQRATVKGELVAGQRIAATGVISLKAAWLQVGGGEDK
ncbi:MAG: efflux RND transporter periplasmic adaptor subunit [Gammaproteobacteria bacterium]|nr:efflux RND transporter periplasmic adaptor subunit [Gammaproteobacteria bacterium]